MWKVGLTLLEPTVSQRFSDETLIAVQTGVVATFFVDKSGEPVESSRVNTHLSPSHGTRGDGWSDSEAGAPHSWSHEQCVLATAVSWSIEPL